MPCSVNWNCHEAAGETGDRRGETGKKGPPHPVRPCPEAGERVRQESDQRVPRSGGQGRTGRGADLTDMEG